MRKGWKIRSEYDADRENRRSVRANIQRNAFGVYHNLGDQSKDRIRATLIVALKEVEVKLSGEGLTSPRVVVPKDHAATYLERRDVVRALKNGSIRHLEPRRLQAGVEVFNSQNSEGVDLSFSGFSWVGGNERKFAGHFDFASKQALGEHVKEIDEILQYAGASALGASCPDHVTFCRYGVSKNRGLAATHRQAIGETVIEKFNTSDISSVRLITLVAGPSYSQPLALAA